MMKWARPLSASASASQVNSLPFTRRFVGAGGGVTSVTAVSLTYCAHARAMALLGSQTDRSLTPMNFADRTGSTNPAPAAGSGASQAAVAGIALRGAPAFAGKRAV